MCCLYCRMYCLQAMMVKEVFKLARHAQAERKLPGFRAQQWYYFFVAAFWVYIRCARCCTAGVMLPVHACSLPARIVVNAGTDACGAAGQIMHNFTLATGPAPARPPALPAGSSRTT